MPVGLELLLKLIFHELGDLLYVQKTISTLVYIDTYLFVEHNGKGIGGLFRCKDRHIVFHELLLDFRLSQTHI